MISKERLARMVVRERGNIDSDTIDVSNPGMGHFAEVEMTGRAEQKHVASVGTTTKGRSWITKRKGKELVRFAAVPSAFKQNGESACTRYTQGGQVWRKVKWLQVLVCVSTL